MSIRRISWNVYRARGIEMWARRIHGAHSGHRRDVVAGRSVRRRTGILAARRVRTQRRRLQLENVLGVRPVARSDRRCEDLGNLPILSESADRSVSPGDRRQGGPGVAPGVRPRSRPGENHQHVRVRFLLNSRPGDRGCFRSKRNGQVANHRPSPVRARCRRDVLRGNVALPRSRSARSVSSPRWFAGVVGGRAA